MALVGPVRLTCAILSAIALAPADCQAEEAGNPIIIVTARRMEEQTLDVPLQVNSLDGGEIEAGSVDGLQSLSLRVPGLSFEAAWGGYNSFPVLRGQSQPSVAGDNVGMFVDGVSQASRDAIDVMPLDLERIEVVQGPQNALFGHSSFAGLISYVPAKPTEQLYVSGAADAGTDNLRGITGVVSGPLGNLVKARLAASYRAADGTYVNLADPGQHLGNTERIALAAGLATRDGSGPLSARLSVRYGDNRSNQPAFFTLDYRDYNCGSQNIASGAWSYFCGRAPVASQVSVSPDVPNSRARTGQVALHLALDLGGLDLRSDTSYYDAKTATFRDFDGSPEGDLYGVCLIRVNCTGIGSLAIPVVRLQRVNIVSRRSLTVSEISQELRIGNSTGGRFDWQVGGTIFWTKTRTATGVGAARDGLAPNESYSSLVLSDFQRVGRPALINSAVVDDPNASQVTRDDAVERRRTLALFATADYRLVERLRLRGEVRVTWERYSLDSRLSNFAPSFGDSLQARHFRDVTPRISLDYRPADGWLIFASYARGSRSGGINPIPNLLPQEQTFAPETNWTAELGAKYQGSGLIRSAWTTAYDIDWRNTQIVGFSITPGISALITHNTTGIHTQGIEFGGTLAPARWIEFDFAYSYADPRFKKGSEDPGSGSFCGLALGIVVSSFCTIGPSLIVPGQLVPDISGNRPARAVATSWTAGLTLSPTMSLLAGLRIHAEISHQGNVFDRQVDGLYYGERTLVGARVTFPLGPCSVELWGTNLGDDRYIRVAVGRGPIFYRDMPRPTDLILADGRRIGLTLRFTR